MAGIPPYVEFQQIPLKGNSLSENYQQPSRTDSDSNVLKTSSAYQFRPWPETQTSFVTPGALGAGFGNQTTSRLTGEPMKNDAFSNVGSSARGGFALPAGFVSEGGGAQTSSVGTQPVSFHTNSAGQQLTDFAHGGGNMTATSRPPAFAEQEFIASVINQQPYVSPAVDAAFPHSNINAVNVTASHPAADRYPAKYPPQPAFLSNSYNASMDSRGPTSVARPSFNQSGYQRIASTPPQLDGNYPGGMGSMQRDFAQMGFNQSQQPRFIDLMQDRNLVNYDMEDAEIKLPPTVCNPDAQCLSSILRCTLRSIPQTQELLKKSRLPFGLTLQPFRDTNDINVIKTSTIVRCRYCRTYINPYVYLNDARHWKCNLCHRVNDLPDDFNWDPVTKSFGEPTRRPELRFANVEFIAPSEYTLRPPQPAVYVFVLDVSHNAVETGYLYTFSEQMLITLDQIPGDDRSLICFIGVDSSIHFFQFCGKAPPRQLIVDGWEEFFLPVNAGLLVNLKKNREVVRSFIQSLPTLYESNSSTMNCLGPALNAAHELIAEIGGRITVLQTTLPNIGVGSLTSREDPNQRASTEVQNLVPATDFYKRFALECTGRQIAVDLFLLNSQYADLSTLAEMAKFSSGSVYHYPSYHMNRDQVQVKRFQQQLNRYLTRKIGFEAVLRIRCSKGLLLHTFYGNFFVRSTDLLTISNVNPDAAFGVQVEMEENLAGLNTVCFQAALLYTSSRGDRRIRIHTLCLPITKDLPTVFSNFDVKCSMSLLCKMAVERALGGSSIADSREAMVNAVIDAMGAFNAAVSQPGRGSSLLSPTSSLSLFPLYVLGLLKHNAFSYGRSVKLDDRVSSLLLFRSAPLEVILLELCPALYQLSLLNESEKDPPRLRLSYEQINRDCIYLMDTGSYVYIYVTANVNPSLIKDLFGADSYAQIDEDKIFETLDTPVSVRVHNFIRKLSVHRSLFAPVIVIRENSQMRDAFTRRLIEDRTESSHSYIEFLHHIRQEMQK